MRLKTDVAFSLNVFSGMLVSMPDIKYFQIKDLGIHVTNYNKFENKIDTLEDSFKRFEKAVQKFINDGYVEGIEDVTEYVKNNVVEVTHEDFCRTKFRLLGRSASPSAGTIYEDLKESESVVFILSNDKIIQYDVDTDNNSGKKFVREWEIENIYGSPCLITSEGNVVFQFTFYYQLFNFLVNTGVGFGISTVTYDWDNAILLHNVDPLQVEDFLYELGLRHMNDFYIKQK